MKKIKLFPAPHIELRISVSDEMETAMRECRESFVETGNDCDCNKCPWDNIELFDTGICELGEVWKQVLEDKDEKINT